MLGLGKGTGSGIGLWLGLVLGFLERIRVSVIWLEMGNH